MDDTLTPRQAFKVGFLYRCAQEGLDEDATAARVAAIEKRAADDTASSWADLINPMSAVRLGIGTGKFGLKTLGAGLIGAAGLGAGGAALLHKVMNHPVDPDDAKRQELIGAYNSYAEQIRRRNQQRGGF